MVVAGEVEQAVDDQVRGVIGKRYVLVARLAGAGLVSQREVAKHFRRPIRG